PARWAVTAPSDTPGRGAPRACDVASAAQVDVDRLVRHHADVTGQGIGCAIFPIVPISFSGRPATSRSTFVPAHKYVLDILCGMCHTSLFNENRARRNRR